MIEMIKNWQGRVNINGIEYDSVKAAENAVQTISGTICIKLYPKTEPTLRNDFSSEDAPKQEIRITVKKYMTEKSSPGFDFMAKWNEDKPMPLRTMTGTIEKETRGMVYMHLHGDIWATKICTCMKCGKQLTNPISQYFGIGPECGGHHYTSPFDTEEELQKAVAEYKAKLQEVTWSGWVIKSAILEQEEV